MISRNSITLCLLVAVAACGAFGQPKKVMAPASLDKTTGTPARTWLNINQLSTATRNTGWMDNGMNDTGLEYPKGSGKKVGFITTFMWSYQLRSTHEIQAGGVPYTIGGMQPGKVLPGGVVEDPNLPKNRIYRVRPDIPPDNATADLRSELQQKEGTADQIYTQYHTDWLEWPWQDGAPYVDVNRDGKYDSAVDVPGVQGADQTVWFVCNDKVIDYSKFGGTSCMKPIGMELQVTLWAYNRQDPLGYMYFTRYLMINKGRETLDSAYVTIFSDPDLGDYSDDFVGSDTTRSMVYDYNSKSFDQVYAPLPPPAFGIDFFQGPMVPGLPADSALFRNKWIRGRRNLPMTTSYAFNSTVDQVVGDVEWDPRFWMNHVNNLCKGLTRNGQVILDPRTGKPTKFRFAGDPEKRTGWLDGVDIPPDDRRMGMASGPFTMAPGDTQEVVTSEIVAGALQGGDQLTSVHLLKQYSDAGQRAYNSLFNLATAPPPPKVTAAELDRELVLTWGDDAQAVNATETYNNQGFRFQGYHVYQFPTQDPVITSAKKLATYDIVDGVTKIVDQIYDPSIRMLVPTLIQEGTDSGIKRSIHLKTNVFNGDNRLINGKPYYFAVTSYNYSPDSTANPSALENPIVIIKATPHSANPGARYASSSGDTIRGVVHTTVPGGIASDGWVIPVVIDPSKITGHAYRVTFDTSAGVTTWNLIDQTNGQTSLSKQSNQNGDGSCPMVDGTLVEVFDPPPGWRDWQVPAGQLVWTDSSADGMGLEGFDVGGNGFGAMGAGFNWLSGSSVKAARLRNVLIKFAACDGTWNPNAPPSDDNYSYAYRYMRSAQFSAAKPGFAPFIINKVNYGYQDFKKSVPFSAWDVNSSPPRRLAVGHLENNVAGGTVDGKYWPPDFNAAGNAATSGPREWFFVFDKDYASTPDPSLQVAIYNDISPNSVPIMWWGTPARKGNIKFSVGDQFLIRAYHANTPADTFKYATPQNTINDGSLAKEDIKQINVFPNPYYGVNPQEPKATDKFVTFSHLPARAVIRIFNFGGVMVRRLEKDSPSQFLRWDLRNEYGLLVGSGLYIAYIEMSDLGVTRTLKLAIVQEQQVLE